jgi:hypothetical protein
LSCSLYVVISIKPLKRVYAYSLIYVVSAIGQKQTSTPWHVHSECPLSGEKRTLRLGTLTQRLTETFGHLRTSSFP